MKKLFSILSLILLFSMTALVAIAEEGAYAECDAKLKEELLALIRNDKNGILGLQFKLTTLKMLKRTMASESRSLAALIKKDNERLVTLNTKNPEILRNLETIYDGHAKEHAEAIEALQMKAPHFDHLTNKDISSYLLYEKLTRKDTDITKLDIAITWYLQKVSNEVEHSTGKTSPDANLIGLNHRLSLYMVSNGIEKLHPEEIEKELKRTEAAVNKFMSDSAKHIKQNVSACIKDGKWKDSCEVFDQTTIENELATLLEDIGTLSSSLVVQQSRQIARDDYEKLLAKAENDTFALIIEASPRPATISNAPGAYETSAKLSAPVAAPSQRLSPASGNACPANLEDIKKVHQIEFAKQSSILSGLEALGSLLKGTKVPSYGKRPASGTLDFRARRTDYQKCCENRPTPVSEWEYRLGILQKFGMKFYYGIPYGAELGIKGTLEAGINGSFTYFDPDCRMASNSCSTIALNLNPALALYAEVAAGLAAVEGGVKWEPKAEFVQCIANPMPPAEIKLGVGDIFIYYKAIAGWVFSWEDRLSINNAIGLPSDGDAKVVWSGVIF